MTEIERTKPYVTCPVCQRSFVVPQSAACDRDDCPPNAALRVDGNKLMQVLLDVTKRWANDTDVDARAIALAYGGAAGACFLTLPEADRTRVVRRMCAVLIATCGAPLEVRDYDSLTREARQ